MIDDDDVDFAILAMQPTTAIGACFAIVLVLGISYVAYQNRAECSERTCAPGLTARVMNHECVCVGTPQ